MSNRPLGANQKHPADPVAMWNSAADTFDDAPDHGLTDPVVRDAWRRLFLGVLPPPPARIADLGCGTGSLSVLLAEAGYSVLGVDSAPRMVELAEAKAAAIGASAEFTLGDAADPRLPDGQIDVILVRHVLWALPAPDAAIARWVAALRPGGLLVLVEGRWSTGSGLSARQAAALVSAHRRQVAITPLEDPALWGGPITDERYLLVSTG